MPFSPGIFRNEPAASRHSKEETGLGPRDHENDRQRKNHDPGEKRSDTAFVALLPGHQIMLRNFVASLIPAIDVQADIAQEINILLWEKRTNFELDLGMLSGSGQRRTGLHDAAQ